MISKIRIWNQLKPHFQKIMLTQIIVIELTKLIYNHFG